MMAVTESSGNGYALYNGVKLPTIDSVWTDEVKAQYPYAAIGMFTEGTSFYSEVIFSTTPLYNLNGVPMLPPEAHCYVGYGCTNSVEMGSDINNQITEADLNKWVWGLTMANEAGDIGGYNQCVVASFLPIVWTNGDILNVDNDDNTDGSVFLSATDPIPLDGMNVIEWDGDTEGLEGFGGGSTFYHVSNAVDVDISKACHIVRQYASDGRIVQSSGTFQAKDGYYALGVFVDYVNTASEAYPMVGVYLRKPTQTVTLFAYYPVETNTHTITDPVSFTMGYQIGCRLRAQRGKA